MEACRGLASEFDVSAAPANALLRCGESEQKNVFRITLKVDLHTTAA
jgi:hypothetical protein